MGFLYFLPQSLFTKNQKVVQKKNRSNFEFVSGISSNVILGYANLPQRNKNCYIITHKIPLDKYLIFGRIKKA